METEFKPEITAIQVEVNRSTLGLLIKCRTNPKIEDFFRNLSAGAVDEIDIRVQGRYWIPRDGSQLIRLYSLMDQDLNKLLMTGHQDFPAYKLNAPGTKLVDVDRNNGLMAVNISFLRSVGISDRGIEFSVKGVFSESQVVNIRDGILAATTAFCEAYLKPINLTINLVES